MGRSAMVVIGVVGVVLGALFTLQGVGLVGGSFMSGQGLWLGVGVVLVVIGIGVVGAALTTRRRTRG